MNDPAVEVVVVVTPTSLHAEHIEAALRAGKAVWTEKPIAQEIGDTQKIVDLWRETGCRSPSASCAGTTPGTRGRRS
ncbi:MAG: Gfo/Idh/MocA family oxidoreductase [Chloroflexota bacterium]